ncbi:transcription-repair-coupling factor [Clostridium homopropionicum DSM 5847]|uniref:Transcription-repair-coupling factor n=1 Tax=Clostridium homopropionicum DSM 5847 TaxID=1121318 RepID=A0A0L6Z742_9CLOT|nr:transcription-repair coupling factor [Clostridium homopropionicum]KOA18780.1 transcription-repair-coupling factor [Clostridium homopropionicum DSM 5847]SFG77424.1 transcription-repair coupling factor [Clostridium homopropionicum]
MRLKGLMQPLMENEKFNNVMNRIHNNQFPIEITGVLESGRGYLINGIYEKENSSIFIFTNSDVDAKNLYEDLSFYIPNTYYFPTKQVVFYNIYAISGDLRWERLKVIREMLREGKKIIVTSIEALASAYISPELYNKYTLKLSVGETEDLEEIGKKLIQSGYERVNIVEGKGEFSIRGGILDIYSPILSTPYRIEFFGDEIDSIRSFNSESQRSIEKFNSVEIFPAKEMILTKENINKAYKEIEEDLKKVPEEKIKKDTLSNLESLMENWSFDNIDSFLPYFYDETSNLLDYMKNSLIIINDSQRCIGKFESVYFEFIENCKDFIQKGSILPRQLELMNNKDLMIEKLKESRVVLLDIISKGKNIFKPIYAEEFFQSSLSGYNGKLELLLDEVKDKKAKGYRTIILSGTRPRGERLVETLKDKDIESVYKDVVDSVKCGEVIITFGNQIKGYDFPELKLSIISDKEVFGKSKRRHQKVNKKGIGKIKSFTELKPGDYVVHTNHGIGVYKGIKQLEVQGHKKDYLELSYSSGDKLYVPVEQLDLVQKYIGTEGKAPKVSKLGGSDWSKAKSKVKSAINEIAEELVKLYAIRSTLKGHKFSSDTVWQKQFEEEFPYEETPDQIVAIEEIKNDMESEKVMDRLLCGDVGYGKTEVAVRAAFKAVMDGKQVAFLVPTTILAEQHYNNLVHRFSDFPVRIDMISRFRTIAQVKSTLMEVKAGNVDILIGTHRILQKDVQFKDLGLLIVDEEQRFGVTHKEKIKNLKKNVDVLTLTATPIPRTLHMSLTGIRDISVIETPPEERYPVQTYVVEFNEQLISDAITREVDRGGQVYFVYNRVENIKEMASYLSKLLPGIRIAVAHGQMPERELEKVMLDFMNKKYDMLLCTTIIETGLDIQNANTMIIYDADKFGLSQLYQLRGRVGRTNRIAYAYLTYRKDKVLTEVAEKRLKAIKDFTELGSGFKIAMRDLEIRGSGNIVGAAQHGHMASVGYDLYCRMLEDTIKLVRGEIDKEPFETTIDLKVDAYIPSDYIDDEVQKIQVYKKIASIDSKESMMDIQEEIEDRFSDIPLCIYNLINIAYLKSVANKIGIEEIKERPVEVEIKFQSRDFVNQGLIKNIIKKYNKRMSFKVGQEPVLGFSLKDVKKTELIQNLKEFLEYIQSVVETP